MKKYTDEILAFFIPVIRTILFITAGLLILTIPSFKGKSLVETSRWWSFAAILVNIITVFVLVLLAKREGKKYRDLLCFAKGSKIPVKEILIAVLIMLPLGFAGLWGFSYLFYGYMPVTMIQPLPIWAAAITALLLPVSIVLAEIPLYVGYCVPRIKAQTGSTLLSYVYPLFFYALQHSFMPLIFETNHIVSRFFIFIPLLIMIAIWHYRKKSLIPLIIGHGILDLSVGVQIIIVSICPEVFEAMKNAVS